MASLWEECTSSEEEIFYNCTTITAEAGDFAIAVYQRMPIVLAATAQSI